MDDFAGKVAVITGGGSGIGAAMARGLAERGARVMLADVDEKAMDGVAAELGGKGADVACTPVDVRDPAAVEHLAVVTERTFGGVDIVCNNAGVAIGGLLSQTTLDDWRFVMDVNFWGIVHGVQAFVPRFVAQGSGHVVNTGSMAGLIGMAGLGVYTASKFAVVGLSEALHRELAPAGVGVTVLCPMMVDTPLNENSLKAVARSRGEPEPLLGPEVSVKAASGMKGGVVRPEDVAARVLDAVQANELYALTHPEQRAILARRSARLDEAAARVPQV